MSKKNKYVLSAVIIFAVILILGITWIMLRKEPEDLSNEVQIGMESIVTEESQTVPAENQTVPAENQTIPAESEETGTNQVPENTETTEQQADETVPNEKPSETKETQNDDVYSLCFPYSIPGSNLVIEQMNTYDGPFFEDGSDDEVANVTAMVVTNTGDVCAEYIEITIERDGVPLKFIASALEPGGRMIILEADRKQFGNGTYSNCVADVATLAEFTMSEDQVRVEENPGGGLYVTNISEKDIPCVRVFYKYYMTDPGVYVGGIAYTAKVTDLAAGASCTIKPSHYLQGYSKVIMVKTYDTDA